MSLSSAEFLGLLSMTDPEEDEPTFIAGIDISQYIDSSEGSSDEEIEDFTLTEDQKEMYSYFGNGKREIAQIAKSIEEENNLNIILYKECVEAHYQIINAKKCLYNNRLKPGVDLDTLNETLHMVKIKLGEETISTTYEYIRDESENLQRSRKDYGASPLSKDFMKSILKVFNKNIEDLLESIKIAVDRIEELFNEISDEESIIQLTDLIIRKKQFLENKNKQLNKILIGRFIRKWKSTTKSGGS
eukprot:TRINITY_DN11651_c0_g1_i1.p1 TRINITY_DN11651_c0_g1~~TRINITY_DN11651_c0_g1_i1.p1  ORF type:complete len:245 (-),score=68.87 TRINITY_DN11651_c0_g1_i1:156-890(-)